jgi:oxaloacetate decarboxylase gamma subunit
MEDVNLIGESFKFMVLGMTVVFAFLTLLIIVVNVQAKVIAKFFPEKTDIAGAAGGVTEAHHVAAIVAAVKEFRKNQ